MVYPYLPSLMTDFFASKAAGHQIMCGDYGPGHAPPECVDAHSTAVVWQSWTSFVSQRWVAGASPMDGSVPSWSLLFFPPGPRMLNFLVKSLAVSPAPLLVKSLAVSPTPYRSVLSFLVNPMLGSLSDRVGRVPFLTAGIAAKLLSMAALLGYVHAGTSLLWLFPGDDCPWRPRVTT